MKFEHILSIYWTNNLLLNTKLHGFNTTPSILMKASSGFSVAFYRLTVIRFELNWLLAKKNIPFAYYKKAIIRLLNVFYSQIVNVNTPIVELARINIIRLYLLKTFRGRAQAIGKPSRGQRTWSNAWTAYNNNKTLRFFISNIRKLVKQNLHAEKVDYKRLKKKFKKNTQPSSSLRKVKKLVNTWF